jgi:hypothetical protein
LARTRLGIDLNAAKMIAQESRLKTIGELVAALKHKEVYRAAAQIGEDWNKERMISKGASQIVLD